MRKLVYVLTAALLLGIVPNGAIAAPWTYGTTWEATIFSDIPLDQTRITFGQDSSATDGFDNRWDTRAMLGGNIKSYFEHPEWGADTSYFWSDIRSYTMPIPEWTFYVTTGSAGLSVTMTWDVTMVPAGMGITLTDVATGATTDMRALPNYMFSSSSTSPREFKVTVNGTIADGGPPDTVISKVTPGGSVSYVDYTGTDDVWNVSSLVYSTSLDGGAWSGYSGSTSASFTGLADGTHSFTVVAKDGAGNVDLTPASVTFTVDNTPPSFTITTDTGAPRKLTVRTGYPNSAWVIGGKVVNPADFDTFTYVVADSYGQYSKAGSITIRSDGTFAISLAVPSYYDSVGGTRVYTATFTAKDKAGNTTVKSTQSYVGTTAP